MRPIRPSPWDDITDLLELFEQVTDAGGPHQGMLAVKVKIERDLLGRTRQLNHYVSDFVGATLTSPNVIGVPTFAGQPMRRVGGTE